MAFQLPPHVRRMAQRASSRQALVGDAAAVSGAAKGGHVDAMAEKSNGAAPAPDALDLALLSSTVGCRLVRWCKIFDLLSLSFFNALDSFQAV